MSEFDFPAYALIEHAAVELGSLVEDVLFVGGATIGFYITEPSVRHTRPTDDVDAVVQAVTRGELAAYEQRMRAQGFAEDQASGILCRWRKGALVVDLMPTGEASLGFSNRWYPFAFARPCKVPLSNGIMISIPLAPEAVACKVEAFLGRGKFDFQASPDMEDVIAIVDGRPELADELLASDPTVREFLSESFRDWLDHHEFLQAIQGHLAPDRASQERSTIVLDRIRNLC